MVIGRHVGRELEHRGMPFTSMKRRPDGKRNRRRVIVGGGEHESPFAEGGNVDVVRIGVEAGLLEVLRDAPERIAREHRRGALHHDYALGA